MSTEANKALVERFVDEMWRQRDLTAFDRYFSPTYQDAEISGDAREGLKRFFAGYFSRRPDFAVTTNDLLAEGDRVVQLIRATFTNTEERLGVIGKPMQMEEINIFTIRGGLIAERFGIGRSLG